MVSKVSVDSEVADNLFMVHDPFADTTTQPKIPDGKVNNSLGFTTSVVEEIKPAPNNGEIHCLLYAGTNSMSVWRGTSNFNAFDVGSFVYNFEGSGAVDFSSFTLTEPPPDPQSQSDEPYINGIVTDPEKYALWRVVSAGLQLKLLNSVEEDDGWWEAIRINEPLDAKDYVLTLGGLKTDVATDGTIAPSRLLERLSSQNGLANDPTYSTGLLRDLHRFQFELHGRKDYHDFTERRSPMYLSPGVIDVENSEVIDDVYVHCPFNEGRDEAFDIINNYIDSSYDMVYLRFHCRSPADGENATRMHMNLRSNQEIYFAQGERENRFHTDSMTVGADMMSLHFQGRRMNSNAATLIG